MFWFIVDILTLRRFGLGRPFRYLILVVLFGAIIAGLIYAFVMFQAVSERSQTPHVHTSSAH